MDIVYLGIIHSANRKSICENQKDKIINPFLILKQQYPVTANNMNFALIPFAFVIGLATLVYAFSGRRWFTGLVRNIDPVIICEEDSKVIQETRRDVLLNEGDVGEQPSICSQVFKPMLYQ